MIELLDILQSSQLIKPRLDILMKRNQIKQKINEKSFLNKFN
jgi:hypothetical protein